MLFQDGREDYRVCRSCHEDNGGEIARTRDRSDAASLAALLTERAARPPRFPGWREDADVSAISTFTPEPRALTRGGAAASLVIGGTGFASGDEIEYGHVGITNASAPVITATQVTLSVQASIAVPAGSYDLTYNDVVYRNVFDVRT